MFKLVDIDGDGSLGRDDIYYFYKAQVQETTDSCGLKNEELTEATVINSERPSNVLFLLIDYELFYDTFYNAKPTVVNIDDSFEEEEED